MSENQNNDDAWKVVESFINLANEHASTLSPGSVSSALLYAASRFNAFIVASNAEDFTEEKEQSIQYFLGQYEKMLRDNMDDYEQNPVQ
jgi:hypothetical protein